VNAVIVPEGNGKWNEYAGGYSDMLAQRGADILLHKGNGRGAGKAAKDSRPTAAPAPSAAKTRRKLSFNEKYELDNLPKLMAKLETDVKALQAKLDDPTLYARDRTAFDAISTALAAVQAELHAAEEKWLELEMLREEIENG
jgi:ATP-binding cassette subfamily F protein uup